MEVVLLEKIGQLGDLGAQVNVRPGYARNFLIPKGKALPATKENVAYFEAQRAEYEARQAEVKATAEELAAKIAEVEVVLDRPAGTTEKLFGSVTNADIAQFYKNNGVEVSRKVIDVMTPIRTLGEHPVVIRLHPDVCPEVTVRVDRSVR
ncbi:MAG: 50S ribosomal protein L9 [Magnetococcales bacterium]|nr:50S ribosomal protein L9 [Magnetococcales bacterium]